MYPSIHKKEVLNKSIPGAGHKVLFLSFKLITQKLKKKIIQTNRTNQPELQGMATQLLFEKIEQTRSRISRWASE